VAVRSAPDLRRHRPARPRTDPCARLPRLRVQSRGGAVPLPHRRPGSMNAPSRVPVLLLAVTLALAAGIAAADGAGPAKPDNSGASNPGAGPKPAGATTPGSA